MGDVHPVGCDAAWPGNCGAANGAKFDAGNWLALTEAVAQAATEAGVVIPRLAGPGVGAVATGDVAVVMAGVGGVGNGGGAGSGGLSPDVVPASA